MPAKGTRKRQPSYRLHKPSGQAVVTIAGKDHYLGVYDSKASRAEYARLLKQWEGQGCPTYRPTPRKGLTVLEVAAGYTAHAQAAYKAHTLVPIVQAVRVLCDTCGTMHAEEFGPKAYKSVREAMIGEGLARTTINQRMAWVRAVFSWAVSEELVSGSVAHALRSVPALRYGAPKVREPEKVQPVADEVVEATLPHLPQVVADMVRVQRLTGCRPGEVCRMTPAEIDLNGDIWVYHPKHHKTAHHGHARHIPIGPRAQAIIRPYLQGCRVDGPLFPLAAAVKPNGKPYYRASRGGEFFTTHTYCQLIRYASKKAFRPEGMGREEFAKWDCPHMWHPNQLRHTAATVLRREAGIEAARVTLGHSNLQTSEIYSERDLAKASELARKLG